MPRAAETQRLAAIAQLVEHIIRNDGVGGSNPSCGTNNQTMNERNGAIEVAPLARHEAQERRMKPNPRYIRMKTPITSKIR